METEERLGSLTAKEREVLEAVATGKTNKPIAENLGLSLRAVEDRRARPMRKVRVGSVAELVLLLADRSGK